jgi:hypothetical protein
MGDLRCPGAQGILILPTENEILSRGPYQATGFEGLVRDVDAHDSGPQDARSCPAMAVE